MNEIAKLIENIKVENFYCVTVWKNRLDLQGKLTKENLDYCEEIGIKNFELKNGFLTSQSDKIRVNLSF